jgi:hypothetical protein
MTGSAAIFYLAIAIVERTMHLSKDGSARHDHQMALARLGQQFRYDAHQAKEAKLDDDARLITFSSANGNSVTYKIDGTDVHRETAGREPGKTAREVYRLADDSVVRIETSKPAIAQLTVLRKTHEAERLECRVAAQTARLGSLQSPTKGP